MKHTSMRTGILLGLLAISLFGLWKQYSMTSLRQQLQNNTLIIAHRGASSTAPENSIVSIEQALLSQADLIELDFFINETDDLIVMHDVMVEDKPIWSYSTSEFLAMNITQKEKFAASYTNIHPPLLKEAISLILSQSTPLIEYKRNPDTPDISARKAAEHLITLLETNGWREKVVIQSFDIQFLAYCRVMAPDLILGWLIMDELIVHLETVEKELDPEIIGWKREHLTEENISWIQERSDALIWSWYGKEDKINDPAYTLNMIEKGIRGIITDYPAQARVVLQWKQEKE